jgi:hypothetical protein
MDEGNPLILKEEAPKVQEEEESGFSGIFVSCSEGEEGSLSRYVLYSSSVTETDPHQSERWNPDPYPHQSDILGPGPHQVEDDKQKRMEYEPI